MLQKIEMGTQVRALTLQRLNCAEGTKCRAVLLDPNPRVKYMAWDESLRKNVEVDQNLMIEYQLRPYTAYFYLVGKLNTDMKGNVVDDEFTIEYMQLSDSVNSEFMDTYNEMGGQMTSLAINKVSKKTDKGDFSHLVVKASNYPIDNVKGLPEKLAAVSDPDKIELLWGVVDSITSLSKEQYVKMKAELPQETPKIQPVKEVKQLSQESQQIIAPPAIEGFGDEFSTEDFI